MGRGPPEGLARVHEAHDIDAGRRRRRAGDETLRPPVDLADATHRAEVSLATASAITEKALLDYREARCRGAAWLWARATKRAGGSRTIVLFILHLWKNHTIKATAERKHIEQIIQRYTLRRRRFLVREWRRVARIQRAERRAELEEETRQKELREAREAQKGAEDRCSELVAKVADLEKQLKASKERELTDEERKNQTKNATFRARVRRPRTACWRWWASGAGHGRSIGF